MAFSVGCSVSKRLSLDQIEDRATESLAFLTDTDEKAADLKMAADTAEARYEAILDALFLHGDGPVENRKAAARASVEAQDARLAYLEARRLLDGMTNRRRTEAIVIDWLRSLASNRKQGL